MHLSRLPTSLVAGAFGVAALTGCGAQDASAPRAVAEDFAEAIVAGDGAAACRLLSPASKAEVEQSSGTSCGTAILAEDLPDAGAFEGVSTFGAMAQVSFAGDVMFLGEFPRGWRVLSAGCAPVPDRPYDCQIQAG